VYDENQLGADEIQEGTHNASHLYARATKAVSLIPAAYYADLACERGRCYLNEFLVDDKTSAGGKSGKSGREEEKARVFNAARDAWGEGVSRLFFSFGVGYLADSLFFSFTLISGILCFISENMNA
jgi:hypothetical protein